MVERADVSVEGNVTSIMFPELELNKILLGVYRGTETEYAARAVLGNITLEGRTVPDYYDPIMRFESALSQTEASFSQFLEEEGMMVLFNYTFCGEDRKWLPPGLKWGGLKTKGLSERLHEIKGVRISARMWPSPGYVKQDGNVILGKEEVLTSVTEHGDDYNSIGIVVESLVRGVPVADAKKIIDHRNSLLNYRGSDSSLELVVVPDPTQKGVGRIASGFRAFADCIKASQKTLQEAALLVYAGLQLDDVIETVHETNEGGSFASNKVISRNACGFYEEADELLKAIESPATGIRESLDL